jgi:hypothetical protein
MSNGSTTLGSLNAIVDWRPNDDGIFKGNSESQEAILSAAKTCWTSSDRAETKRKVLVAACMLSPVN